VLVRRLVSGGQTGVDRAALEFAREHAIPLGGWCPAGGLAEDHADPPGVRGLFPELRETASADPAERTLANVRDSDATLVLTRSGTVSPGTALTIRAVVRQGRPHMVADVRHPSVVRQWLQRLDRPVLNVAGPRESQAPGIGAETMALLAAVLPESTQM
jgi:hypothetical protein